MAIDLTPTIERIITEGAELYCERRGSGPPLLLITGGIGDAGFYSSAANILANEFTVLNYDRRCNSRSTGDRSIDMTVAQQARDAIAIIKAMGHDKAIIFGSSGGGIIGLELAAANPNVIDFLIVHEPPVIGIKFDSFHSLKIIWLNTIFHNILGTWISQQYHLHPPRESLPFVLTPLVHFHIDCLGHMALIAMIVTAVV